MITNFENPVLTIKEQQSTEVLLLAGEATFLREELGFDVLSCDARRIESPETGDRSRFVVNPSQYVGHFLLPTGTTLIIRPKIPAANVFRMLAYVYAGWNHQLFDEADVLYAHDDLLFEPIVQLFNHLIAKRARHGLVQDYIHNEDNLRVLKGTVSYGPHLRNNVPAHPDRLFCRYCENTCDIEDNQIVKWTLRSLLPFGALWSDRTLRMLRSNFHQLEAVSLKKPSRSAFDRRHYHKLNEDYRVIHSLCRLFLDCISISELRGQVSFHGFRLDMNELFERFVTEAFLRVTRGSDFSALPQKDFSLSEASSDFLITIVPDLTVLTRGVVVSIVDAKYKKTDSGIANQDFYQVLAYGIGLNCPQTYLFFPASEFPDGGQTQIKHSSVTINVRLVDIEDPQCVELVEKAACQVLVGAKPALR